MVVTLAASLKMKNLEYPALVLIGMVAVGSTIYGWSLKTRPHQSVLATTEQVGARSVNLVVAAAQPSAPEPDSPSAAPQRPRPTVSKSSRSQAPVQPARTIDMASAQGI